MYTVDHRQRLDVFLAQSGAVVSRVKAAEAIRAGRVAVNGRRMDKPALMVLAGDRIEFSPSDAPVDEHLLTPVDLHLEILYEDEDCMVINKPAGISVHPAAGIPKDVPTILHGIAYVFRKKNIPFAQSSVLVHRLDKDTTGYLLIAKHEASLLCLQKQFADRTVGKEYLALVVGCPTNSKALIDAPIGRHSGDRKKMAVTQAVAHRRDARTSYHILDVAQDRMTSLLNCHLHTGRTHQIRVHLSSIGHPVLGDPTYASPASTACSEQHQIELPCLHSWKLTFKRAGGSSTAVQAPLSKHFLQALSTCGIPHASVENLRC